MFPANEIPNIKTALNLVAAPALLTIYSQAKTLVQYQKFIEKSLDAQSIKGRLNRDIQEKSDALYGATVENKG